MRIGLVIYGTLDTISGGYLYDRKLVEYLRRAGDAVQIISFPFRHYAAHLSDNFSNDLLKRLRDARVDVLLQDELNHPSLFQLNHKFRTIARAPIVAIVHHLRSSEAHPTFQKLFYRGIEKQYLASVDGFVFNSNTTRDAVSQMLGYDPTSFVVAHPAGDRFDPQIDSATISNRARERGALRIVFIGNLIPRKGLHTLLDALARVPANTAQITIIGNPNVDAHYTAQIREQIKSLRLNNARLVGAIQDDALANILIASHLLIVPSDYEGYGIVYLEGMSFGLPAIGTTAGAASEIIANGVNGFLIAPNDAATLAEHIATLQRDRQLLAQIGLAARARFLEQPRWDESMSRIRGYLLEASR
ncbi:MAG: glycosyltransferase family 4 protein [Chloroflexi bacterium]|nr:glycosyltransferase family 4 protein [Chloroflexota bacterium]